MRFGSLFSGIGGFDLGLERAGMTCAWQVEKDPFRRRVLAQHWPHVTRHEDIRHVGKHNLAAVDLICGGFPCQPFSNAGKQRGAEDDRNLWPEMRRLVDELRPRWVLGENVTGIVGLYLDTVLADLEAQGYEVWAVDLPAVALGAPHIRHRIWIMAYAEGGRLPQQQNKFSGKGEVFLRSNTRRASALADARAEQSERWGEPQRVDGEAGNGQEAAEQRERLRDAPQHRGSPLSHPKVPRLAFGGGRPGQDTGTDRQAPESGCYRSARCDSSGGWLADYWAAEPGIRRVVDGFPGRVDRLAALGDAIVPVIPQLLGEYILAIEQQTGSDS